MSIDPEATPVERPEKTPSPEEGPSLQMKIAGPEEIRVGGAGLIVALCVLGLVTAALTILLALAKRRAAIERSKAKIAEEALEKARETAKLDANEKARDDAAVAIGGLLEKVDKSKAEIPRIDAETAEAEKKLAKVTSWDELFKD